MSPSGDGLLADLFLGRPRSRRYPKFNIRRDIPLNEDRANIAVIVNSRFRKGSFEIDIDLIFNVLAHSQQLLELAGKRIRDATELADLIGLTLSAHAANTEINLIGLIKLLRGRVPEVIPTDNQQNTVRINIEGDQYDVNADVVNLYQSRQVMEALTETVKPVTAEGIDKVQFLEDGESVQEIVAEDAPYFGAGNNPTEVEELIAPHERLLVVQIIKPSFEPNLRWSVSDGDSRYGISMKDETFLSKLYNRDISFSKGDVLKVRMTSRTSRFSDGSLHTDNTITEVIEHIKPGMQRSLL